MEIRPLWSTDQTLSTCTMAETAGPVGEIPVCKASLVALVAFPAVAAVAVPMVLWVAVLEVAATVVRAASV